jgi:ribonucleoside-diphosphate reductase beta chain
MIKGNTFAAANWNDADDYDVMIFDKLVSQFWIPQVFAISNDLATWRAMPAQDRLLVMRVFTGLTMLDTLQAEAGAPAMLADAQNDVEAAVWANITFMEAIHARSYSTIFQTLCSTQEINSAFAWSEANPYLQRKAQIVYDFYMGGNKHKKKIATVMLESFLFYSGFFLPLYLHGHATLTNTGDLIKTIIKDEAVHGAYAGAKFQQGTDDLTNEEREELQDWTYDLIEELYANEVKYTEDLYQDREDLIADVKVFLRYNANRALMNLGYDPLYKKEDPNPVVMNGLSLDVETHDFFSTKGNYTIGKVAQSTDDTWSWFKK